MNLISKKISLDDSVTIKLTKHGAELYLEWAKRYEHLDDIIVEENDEIKTFSDPVREAIFAKRREILEKEMVDQGLEPQGKEDEPEPVAAKVALTEQVQAAGKLSKLQESRALLDSLKHL